MENVWACLDTHTHMHTRPLSCSRRVSIQTRKENWVNAHKTNLFILLQVFFFFYRMIIILSPHLSSHLLFQHLSFLPHIDYTYSYCLRGKTRERARQLLDAEISITSSTSQKKQEWHVLLSCMLHCPPTINNCHYSFFLLSQATAALIFWTPAVRVVFFSDSILR